MRELRQLREENGKLKRLVADLAPAFCAEQLNQARWSARVALRSRDQGVEIIAEKSGLRVVASLFLPFSEKIGGHSMTYGSVTINGLTHEVARIPSGFHLHPNLTGPEPTPGPYPEAIGTTASGPAMVIPDSGPTPALVEMFCTPTMQNRCPSQTLAYVSIDLTGITTVNGYRDPGSS